MLRREQIGKLLLDAFGAIVDATGELISCVISILNGKNNV